MFDGPNMFDSATAWTGIVRIHPPTGVDPGDPPGAPTGFNVSAGSSSFAGSWDAPTSFEGSLSYRYGYRVSGGSWANASTTSRSFSVSHTSLTPGASYEFRVRSEDDNGVSGYVTDTATVPVPDPGAPTEFNVSAGSFVVQPALGMRRPDFEGSLSYEYGYRVSGGSWVNGTTASTSFSISHTSFTAGRLVRVPRALCG